MPGSQMSHQLLRRCRQHAQDTPADGVQIPIHPPCLCTKKADEVREAVRPMACLPLVPHGAWSSAQCITHQGGNRLAQGAIGALSEQFPKGKRFVCTSS